MGQRLRTALKQSAIANQVTGTRFRLSTDGRARKCYGWEGAATRQGIQPGPFAATDCCVSREIGKGLARLMAKVALRKLVAKHGLEQVLVDRIRADFKSRFTREDLAWCFGGLRGVYFSKWGWRPWIIAHEVAHWVDHWEREIVRQERTGHSAEWLGWYAFLLVDVVHVDQSALSASLKAAGLRFVLP
jgi:hypothetical protein